MLQCVMRQIAYMPMVCADHAAAQHTSNSVYGRAGRRGRLPFVTVSMGKSKRWQRYQNKGTSRMNIFTTQQNSTRVLKQTLLGTLGATPLMLAILGGSAGSAFAQAAPSTPSAPAIETVVSTGTRITRDGFEAPTPVTVITADQIQSVATSFAADYLNELPQFAGSTTPLSTAPGINNSQG